MGPDKHTRRQRSMGEMSHTDGRAAAAAVMDAPAAKKG